MKKVPLRKCIGCMESKPKKELLRIVKDKENNMFVDVTGKCNGRGAYICYDTECLKKAIKQKRFQRQFEIQDIDNEIIENIEKAILEKKINN